jgi:hypothetical protein
MPSQQEKFAEKQLIKHFANKFKAKIVKLQGDVDDGKTDGIIEYNNIEINVEARCKGYPNHKGYVTPFKEGWDTKCLTNGIFLNESTIRNHKQFIFIVKIKGFKPRCCLISPSKINKLLQQPYEESKSTNTGKMQSVKKIPLNWFKEY